MYLLSGPAPSHKQGDWPHSPRRCTPAALLFPTHGLLFHQPWQPCWECYHIHVEFLQTVAAQGRTRDLDPTTQIWVPALTQSLFSLPFCIQVPNCRLKLEKQNLRRKAKHFVYMFEIFHIQIQKAEQNTAQITQGDEAVTQHNPVGLLRKTGRWQGSVERQKGYLWAQTRGGHSEMP